MSFSLKKTLSESKRYVAFFIALPALVLLVLIWMQGDQPNLRKMKYIRGNALQANEWQKRLREQIGKLLRIDNYVAGKKIAAELLSEESFDGYSRRKYSMISQSGRTTTFFLGVPDNVAASLPAVICIPGHGDDINTVFEKKMKFKGEEVTSVYKGYAEILSQKGFVTLSVNVGYHETSSATATLMGERILDLFCCVDFLNSLPEVDGHRIGCAGLSLGGAMSMWLAALDERINSTVSAGFLSDISWLQRPYGSCPCWKFEGFKELADFADIYSLIAPRALLCQVGAQETIVPADIARKAFAEIMGIYEDMAMPDKAMIDLHPGDHEINLETLIVFFQENLCF